MSLLHWCYLCLQVVLHLQILFMETETDAPIDITSALKEVFMKSMAADGLVRGLHQCAKALDRREAQLCVLAENCDEPAYLKLVEALCVEHNTNLVKVTGLTLKVVQSAFQMEPCQKFKKSNENEKIYFV